MPFLLYVFSSLVRSRIQVLRLGFSNIAHFSPWYLRKAVWEVDPACCPRCDRRFEYPSKNGFQPVPPFTPDSSFCYCCDSIDEEEQTDSIQSFSTENRSQCIHMKNGHERKGTKDTHRSSNDHWNTVFGQAISQRSIYQRGTRCCKSIMPCFRPCNMSAFMRVRLRKEVKNTRNLSDYQQDRVVQIKRDCSYI